MSGASRSVLLLAVLALACQKRAHDEPPPPVASATPVDRLAPGELIPGDKKAFDILLPRDVKIDQALTEVVYASGPVEATDLANYVRARVREGSVSVGASATVFDQVKAIDDSSRLLFIRIYPGPMGRGARMEMRNVTPPPLPDLPSPAERWKQMGLTPEGKVLDPKHLQ
jgi:hypothetical protein